jgi:hypothetical protein
VPGVLLRAEASERHNWGESLERGTTAGVNDAAQAIADAGVAALQRRADPWGAAFAPPSPLTLKLRATMGAEVGVISGALILRRKSPRNVVVTVARAARDAAWLMQHGTANKQVFDNANPGTQPARPFLPMRDGVVDLPPEMAAAIHEVMQAGIQRALSRNPSRPRR